MCLEAEDDRGRVDRDHETLDCQSGLQRSGHVCYLVYFSLSLAGLLQMMSTRKMNKLALPPLTA